MIFKTYKDSPIASLVNVLTILLVPTPCVAGGIALFRAEENVKGGALCSIGVVIWYILIKFSDKVAIKDIMKRRQKAENKSRKMDPVSSEKFDTLLSYGRFEKPARITIHRKSAFFGFAIGVKYSVISVEAGEEVRAKLGNGKKATFDIYYANNIVGTTQDEANYIIPHKLHVSPGENITLVYNGAILKEVIRIPM